MQYYIKRGETVNGPFTGAQVKAGVQSGKLVSTDLVGNSQEGPWKPLENFLPDQTAGQEKPVQPSANGTIEFSCPSCRRTVHSPNSTGGKKGKCPHCQLVVKIPEKSQPLGEPAADEPIVFACPSCSHELRTPVSWAGKKVKCAKCAQVFEIPQAGSPASKPGRPEADQELSLAPVSAAIDDAFSSDLAPAPSENDGDVSDEEKMETAASAARAFSDDALAAAEKQLDGDDLDVRIAALDAGLLLGERVTNKSVGLPMAELLAQILLAGFTLAAASILCGYFGFIPLLYFSIRNYFRGKPGVAIVFGVAAIIAFFLGPYIALFVMGGALFTFS